MNSAEIDARARAGAQAGFGEMLGAFATPFTQNARLVKLQLFEDGALTARLPAQEVTGTEFLSGTYRYQVTCHSPQAGIELKRLLGLPAQIGILTAHAGGQEVIRCGVVTKAEALPSDGGFSRYRLTIEPAFALLRHRVASRVFQDKSVPEIVRTILDEHRANPAFARTFAHRFDLDETYPQRSYCLQYRETDLDFIERLFAEEGISYRFEHVGGGTDSGAERTEIPRTTLVAFDTAYTVPQASQGEIRFHRAAATEASDALTEWTSQRRLGPGAVALTSFDYKPVYIGEAGEETDIDQGEAASAEASLEDFDAQSLYYAGPGEGLARYARLRQAAHDRAKKSFHGAGNVRELKAGEWFRLTGHPDHSGDAPEQAEFVVTRLEFTATNNLPGADADVPPRQPYATEFDAQRRGIALTPDFAHTRHSKPTARGLQTATVVGPQGEEVYTDEMGRIKVQFHFQRRKEHPEFGAGLDERSSCWIRVVYPGAGDGWGHQFIPRIGQEVVVDFIENDIDRPIVTGVVHNGSHPPPSFSGAGRLPANKTLSGIRTKEHHGGQYGELLFDDTTGEVRTKLSSEHGKTQLNMGYLTHPRTDGDATPRGDGFELRTDLTGALRAAQGLLLTAYGRERAGGDSLDRDELLGQLEMALSIAQELARHARTHEADETDTEAQARLVEEVQRWQNGGNTAPEGKPVDNKAVLAMSAPDGVAVTTEAGITTVAGTNHDTVVAKDGNTSIGQNLRMRIGESLSIFVHTLGMKLIAAAGKIRIQAQSDEIEIGAAKRLHLYSLEEIVLDAPRIVLLAQGASVEYGEGITSRSTGAHLCHAANHAFEGPAGVAAGLPGMPASGMETNERMAFAGRSGKARTGVKYEIRNARGQVKGSGDTDGSGATAMVAGKGIGPLMSYLDIGRGE